MRFFESFDWTPLHLRARRRKRKYRVLTVEKRAKSQMSRVQFTGVLNSERKCILSVVTAYTNDLHTWGGTLSSEREPYTGRTERILQHSRNGRHP